MQTTTQQKLRGAAYRTVNIRLGHWISWGKEPGHFHSRLHLWVFCSSGNCPSTGKFLIFYLEHPDLLMNCFNGERELLQVQEDLSCSSDWDRGSGTETGLTSVPPVRDAAPKPMERQRQKTATN